MGILVFATWLMIAFGAFMYWVDQGHKNDQNKNQKK